MIQKHSMKKEESVRLTELLETIERSATPFGAENISWDDDGQVITVSFDLPDEVLPNSDDNLAVRIRRHITFKFDASDGSFKYEYTYYNFNTGSKTETKETQYPGYWMDFDELEMKLAEILNEESERWKMYKIKKKSMKKEYNSENYLDVLTVFVDFDYGGKEVYLFDDDYKFNRFKELFYSEDETARDEGYADSDRLNEMLNLPIAIYDYQEFLNWGLGYDSDYDALYMLNDKYEFMLEGSPSSISHLINDVKAGQIDKSKDDKMRKQSMKKSRIAKWSKNSPPVVSVDGMEVRFTYDSDPSGEGPGYVAEVDIGCDTYCIFLLCPNTEFDIDVWTIESDVLGEGYDFETKPTNQEIADAVSNIITEIKDMESDDIEKSKVKKSKTMEIGPNGETIEVPEYIIMNGTRIKAKTKTNDYGDRSVAYEYEDYGITIFIDWVDEDKFYIYGGWESDDWTRETNQPGIADAINECTEYLVNNTEWDDDVEKIKKKSMKKDKVKKEAESDKESKSKMKKAPMKKYFGLSWNDILAQAKGKWTPGELAMPEGFENNIVGTYEVNGNTFTFENLMEGKVFVCLNDEYLQTFSDDGEAIEFCDNYGIMEKSKIKKDQFDERYTAEESDLPRSDSMEEVVAEYGQQISLDFGTANGFVDVVPKENDEGDIVYQGEMIIHPYLTFTVYPPVYDMATGEDILFWYLTLTDRQGKIYCEFEEFKTLDDLNAYLRDNGDRYSGLVLEKSKFPAPKKGRPSGSINKKSEGKPITHPMTAYNVCKRKQEEMEVIGLTYEEIEDITKANQMNMITRFSKQGMIKKIKSGLGMLYSFR